MASPINMRLLAAAPAARRHLVLTGVAQAVDTTLTVIRAALIGIIAASLIESGQYRWWLLLLLCLVVVAEAVMSFVAKRWASLSIGTAIDQLRHRGLEALARRDPREVEADAAHWRTTLTTGLDGVRPYLSTYVPALIATCLATPLSLAVMLYFDLVSGLLAAATIPLIPLFMVLIGTLTKAHTKRRLDVAGILSGQLTDLMQGAPTLRAFGTTTQPRAQLERTGTAHATATMSVLRLAFLSSFALEFLATLSVALVAVSIGLRLVVGDMTLLAGLVALIIAPEVYAPLRRVGASFHAAADGMTAAEEILDLIDSPATLSANYRAEGDSGIYVHNLSVHGRDGIRPQSLTFTALPGRITVLQGANGSGKSTALLAILGLLPDSSVAGEVRAPALSAISYLPAHPAFAQGDVQSNLVLMGAPTGQTQLAAKAVGLDVPLEQAVHAGGTGISAGQGQRLALARALALPGRHTLVFDEPSAHLSPEFVALLCDELTAEADRGKTVLVATHDPRIVALADQVIEL